MSERQYLDLLRMVQMGGFDDPGRDGAPTRAIFGAQLRFDLTQGFPLLTTKKVHFRSIAYELLWMIGGRTNVRWLQEHGVTIWDEWASETGELGPIYGKQWRTWTAADGKSIDQLMNTLDLLKRSPNTRRAVISAWNAADLPDMALPPCHTLFQFRVLGGHVHCHMYQRSADLFLGLPFNIASYALLTHMVSEVLELPAGHLIISLGDAHIYMDHMDQVREQLTRQPKDLPSIMLKARDHLPAYKFEDIQLLGYQAHPPLPAPVSK